MSGVASHFAGSGPFSRLAYQVVRAIVATVCRLYTRMSIEGRENIPKAGAFVLSPVHRSYVDTPIACAVTRRRLRYMGKDTLWKHRWSGWTLSALGGFPVSRGTADREALKRCIAVLESGQPLVLFPEGERKSGPIVQPLFDGAAYVALRAGVPIVPVGIGGTERVMPKGARFVYPRKVHIIIGEPIMPEVQTDSGRVPRSAIHRTTAELHGRLQGLFDAAQTKIGQLDPSREVG
ncbi:MAG: 1-acyl-sn-glycerol-3-phosphate acyltransferase [Actinomycetota bacterium]|nr:1-acyl-sn-glycerol-3-phosphate acyltransferase [Actinomycetota bacterium]